tara:strand:- start:25097 stop:25555 length:459 start_codon:yes stop_codon:yes gene_type:complete
MDLSQTNRITQLEADVVALQAQVELIMRALLDRNQYQINPSQSSVATVSRETELMTYSPKQIAAIQLVRAGLQTEAMAKALDCTESTIKVHIRGYMRRSDTNSRHKAAVHYEGLIQDLTPERHKKLTDVEMDWAENPDLYPDTTKMLHQKVR